MTVRVFVRILLFPGFYLLTAAAEETPEESYECSAAREFITAWSYVRDSEGPAATEKQAMTLARQVAAGCDGAASRFIRVAETLTRSGLSTADALRLGGEFSGTSDARTDAFLTVFKSSFLKSGLDLDLATAVRFGRDLSIGYHGDVSQALEDFADLVAFCTDREELALPRSRCAGLAFQFTKYGEKSGLETFAPFRRGFAFLTRDEDGPGVSPEKALKLLAKIMVVSPAAVDNFQEAYLFGHRPKGVGLNRNKSIDLALRVAAHTYRKFPAEKGSAPLSAGKGG